MLNPKLDVNTNPKLPPIDPFAGRYGALRYFVAPMAGITDSSFRLLMREMGAQVVISELVSAEGLIRAGQRTKDLMRFREGERPIGIQLFGHKLNSLVEAAKIAEGEGADFIDLNFGCPVRKVVRHGGGAAWLKDLPGMGALLTKISESLSIPLTIKIRSGWDEQSVNAEEVVRIAGDSGVSWVAIHGRTQSQGYGGLADWELIRHIAQVSQVPIIGNGDLVCAEQARGKIDGGYAHGIMIGRGLLRNPWLFAEMAGNSSAVRDFSQLISRHFELAVELKGRARALLSLKKFMAWYGTGYRGAAEFRKRLFQLEDIRALKEFCLAYFTDLPKVGGKQILMGGHG